MLAGDYNLNHEEQEGLRESDKSRKQFKSYHPSFIWARVLANVIATIMISIFKKSVGVDLQNKRVIAQDQALDHSAGFP
jgi:hypothetical protein